MHDLAPQCKIAATFLFVVAVAATPPRAAGAFAVLLCLLLATGAAARVPLRAVLPRLAIELPFVAFALLLPFTTGGERVDAGPLAVSAEGLAAGATLLAKATLGVLATVLLTATTAVPELLRGLEALRVPRPFTAVTSFMLRYAALVAGDARRMRVARASRAYDPRWLWQSRGVASATGALFLRSFERGERVHVAMLSRGFDGSLPRTPAPAPRADWATAVALPLAAAATVLLAA